MTFNTFGKFVPFRIKHFLRKLALSGNNVECPICEKTFVKFLPFGVPPAPLRQNALCLNCGSLERTRIYWKYLNALNGFLSYRKRILHVAPEAILFKKFNANRNFEYYSVDKFEKGYKYPAGTINMDITNLQFEDNYFDFVLCSHVLEHVPEDKKAMSELHRVMRPGGWGILQVPIDETKEHTYEDPSITDPVERQKAFGQSDHVRLYGRDYAAKLRQACFMVELENFAIELPPEQKFRFGFGEGETLYIVRKKAK